MSLCRAGCRRRLCTGTSPLRAPRRSGPAPFPTRPGPPLLGHPGGLPLLEASPEGRRPCERSPHPDQHSARRPRAPGPRPPSRLSLAGRGHSGRGHHARPAASSAPATTHQQCRHTYTLLPSSSSKPPQEPLSHGEGRPKGGQEAAQSPAVSGQRAEPGSEPLGSRASGPRRRQPQHPSRWGQALLPLALRPREIRRVQVPDQSTKSHWPK